MANSNNPKEPIWLTRASKLLKDAYDNHTFKEQVTALTDTNRQNSELLAFLILINYQLTLGTYDALFALSNDPDIEFHKLKELIKPPIKIYKSEDLVNIAIEPYTKKSELIDYINGNWKEIEKLSNSIETVFTPKALKRNIHTPLSAREKYRDYLIIKLNKMGLSDKIINERLSSGKLKFALTEDLIKQRRYELKKKLR